MRTFSIQTLGCKVNQYEAEQMATLLRSRGLAQAVDGKGDLRIVNTCSVTLQAAGKSRQIARRTVELPVLAQAAGSTACHSSDNELHPALVADDSSKLVITGCWATSDRAAAEKLPGVAAVITHHDDVAGELHRLLDQWLEPQDESSCRTAAFGTAGLPMLDSHQNAHQRAFLKVQDGCDAHCTYCIIPKLRPKLYSKSIDDAVLEAQHLVDAGHLEIVLTGIFLGAYGQSTALRRRQSDDQPPIWRLLDALCTRVNGLKRVRLSSLEPGDLSREFLGRLRSYPQVVPHFHLPLQSGSAALLRRMNRQYTRDDFLRLIDDVNIAFDRPALTTLSQAVAPHIGHRTSSRYTVAS